MRSITFEFDRLKAYQVINYLNEHLPEGSLFRMTRLGLLKLLFYADKYHIARYGRFICGGNYFAMPLGPINTELNNLIQDDPIIRDNDKNIETIEPQNYKKLSKSDREALDIAIEHCYNKTEIAISEETHQLKLYKDHYREGTSTIIPTDEFIEDEELKAYVKYWNKENREFDRWLKNEQ